MSTRVMKLPCSLAIVCALVPACGDDAPNQATTMDTDGSESTSATTITTVDTSAETTLTTGIDDSSSGAPESSGSDSSGGVDSSSTGAVDSGSSDSGSGDSGSSSGGSSGDSSSSGGDLCGNGAIDASEDCDGMNLNMTACTDVGFDAGTLACDGNCDFNTAACINFSCGDMMINGMEDCDGTELGMVDCTDLSFDGGTLACANCVFDTTGCFDCGDGTLNGAEECDTNDFGVATCVGEGFDGGMLACTAACLIDTAGCFECGDGVQNGMEECDGMDLDNQTCALQGYFGGTLTCTATCLFDESGCTDCGDGNIDAGEECDGAALGGESCLTIPGGFTGGSLSCDATCGLDDAACTSFALPIAGQVIISEIMQNPLTVPDGAGEWFEIHNPGAVTYQLQSCEISSANDTAFTIAVDFPIGAGEYLTFAPLSMNGPGFTPDFTYPAAFTLNNANDSLTITCNAIVVDTVVYDDGAAFPDPDGASMTLDPAAYDAMDNDDGFNWCESAQNYNGDFGTPGAVNEMCGGPDVDIDNCRLQSPLSIQDAPGTNHVVLGRLFSAGLTDQTAGNDPIVSVVGYVGVGPDGTNPAVDPGWTWVAGMPTVGWNDAADPDFDQYEATLTVPAMLGVYDYAYRFTGDAGTTFTYCDSNGGVYSTANAGNLNAVPAAVMTDLLISEYVEGTVENKALEIHNGALAPFDLDACILRIYSNGSGNFSGLPLTGILAADDVHVVCSPAADAPVIALCDQQHNNAFWSGNDAVALVCNDGMTNLFVDVIGQIAFDPITQWGVDPTSTENNTIRRNCNVTVGDANGNDVFNPATEWTGFPNDTFDGLGTRGCP